jgi:Ni,Fe-hydrogenase III large subunit
MPPAAQAAPPVPQPVPPAVQAAPPVPPPAALAPLAPLLALGQPVGGHQPWPCAAVDAAGWTAAIDALAAGTVTLLSEWAEPGRVHLALLGAGDPPVAVLSLDCPAGRFPSVARLHPPAIRLERAIRDLFGLDPEGLPDPRPWLDHGRWGGETPPAADYPFLPVEGDALHQIPVGPVHAGIIEPGHFRFTCDGETVVRLEERLGYVHKGIDALLTGAPLARAARLAARTSGDSTVAYSLGFARAVEAALGVVPPPRADWLRAVMAELERLANHLGDVGAICNDASFSLMLAHCAVLRERVLRAAAACFGHRLMMDRVVPGGVTADLDPLGIGRLTALTAEVRARFEPLVKLYDETASLQDRTVTTGILRPALARQFGAGGYVGRAAGRDFDARRDVGYAPYDALSFEVPVLQEGDVNARVWIRIREIRESLSLLEQLLRGLPAGPVLVPCDPVPDALGEGMALVEAFRGDLVVWLRIAGGRVDRCHLRDASWFTWPLLEAVIEGNIVADFPICNKSFNCSYSGHDL